MKGCELKNLFVIISSVLILGCGNEQTDIHLVAVEVEPQVHSLPIGRTIQFEATGRYSDKNTENISHNVLWSSSDSNRARVSNLPEEKGAVTGISQGRVTIVATDSKLGISGTAALTITSPELLSLEVNPPEIAIHLGEIFNFKANGLYSDGETRDITSEVNWTSSNSAVPVVSNAPGSKGMCISPPSDSVMIIATDSNTGLKSQAVLSVKKAKLVSISLKPKDAEIPVGKQRRFTATGEYEDGTINDVSMSVVWTSSNTDIAAISNTNGTKGLVKGLSPGPVTIKAVDPNFIISGTTELRVRAPELLSLDVMPQESSVFVNDSVVFNAVGTFSNGNKKDLTPTVIWKSSDNSIAGVDENGKARAMREGACVISAHYPEYSVMGEAFMNVNKRQLRNIVVLPHDPTIFVGRKRQMVAVGVYTDGKKKDITESVIWSSSKPEVAKIDLALGKKGIVTALSNGVAIIEAGDPNSGLTGKTILTSQGSKLAAIVITPSDSSVSLGRSQAYHATGRFTDGRKEDLTKSLKWSSSNESVAKISGNVENKVTVITLSEGVTSVSAADSDSGVTGETVLTVSPAELLSVKVNPLKVSLSLGSNRQFTAAGEFSDGKTRDMTEFLIWETSDTSVVKISNKEGSKGIATSSSVGTAEIIASDLNTGVEGRAVFISRALW